MGVKLFDIQHFCVQDGPGIRTSVFMKGCPLRCLWCHNPESQAHAPVLLYREGKCTLCERCRAACPTGVHQIHTGVHAQPVHVLRRELCTLCGACAAACPEGALELAGREEAIPDIIDEIARDMMFYRSSGGGVTFTGGEPLAQAAVLCELLDGCAARGIHTAVETCCFAPAEVFRRVSEKSDLMICDIKAVTPALHRRLTGADNTGILENIRWLIRESTVPCWIRIPVIPGCNDSDEEFALAGSLLSGGHMLRVELIPYHDTGRSKYSSMGVDCLCGSTLPPTRERLEHFGALLSSFGVSVRLL